ncbi:hypothetical protein J1N35_014359 [Gossypium stocksii]|uniref:Endonuclease/exonuclease/phosphatase domain-containing protein n=1 Tax=Gossypium stocksii TaxID=47602 RepID=A0A9D3VVH9_9ROSI|nr:hypothetical protein J1N35_014359 [Gossypium stocksii]
MKGKQRPRVNSLDSKWMDYGQLDIEGLLTWNELLRWNVRGLGSSRVVRCLQHVLKNLNPMIRQKLGFELGIDVSTNMSWGDIDLVEDFYGCFWRFTSFYGAPKERNRRDSRDTLHRLNNGFWGSWMVAGDFNEIDFSHEK